MNESMTRQPDEVPITQPHIMTDACLGLLKTLGLGISTCLAMIILLLTSTSAII